MRRIWLAPVLLAVALVIQLSVLNGLRLPGGGVPDLVLVLVAALAMANGPIVGMVGGFAAGLCLDLAPPSSQLIGQYALVYCLAGWAAGRLSKPASRSALRCLAFVGLVVAAAEALSAAVGHALEPAQVTLPEIRQVLPSTIVYDLLLCPFAVYLVMLASSLLAGGPARTHARAEDRKRPRPHQPSLSAAAARSGDGWVGSAPNRPHGAHAPARRTPKLRPAGGVAGSASGLVHHRSLPPAPVNLRLSAGRPGDGAIGNAVGAGQRWHPSRHPGLLAGSGRQFRPHGGEPGGSASGHVPRRTVPVRSHPTAMMSFGRHRGDGTVGRSLGSAGVSSPRPIAQSSRRLRLTGSRSALTSPRPVAGTTPRLRMSGSRTALSRRSPARPVPKLNFRTAQAPVARRPASAPRFRRRSSWLRPSATASGLVSGGVLDQSTFRAIRRQHASTPRLRLSGGRRGSGVIGGSRSTRLVRTTSGRAKQPRFGYGRKSVLSFLAGRRIGGRWLARKRVGNRSGVWLIGRRTGGTR